MTRPKEEQQEAVHIINNAKVSYNEARIILQGSAFALGNATPLYVLFTEKEFEEFTGMFMRVENELLNETYRRIFYSDSSIEETVSDVIHNAKILNMLRKRETEVKESVIEDMSEGQWKYCLLFSLFKEAEELLGKCEPGSKGGSEKVSRTAQDLFAGDYVTEDIPF